jgi:hypothetical protein
MQDQSWEVSVPIPSKTFYSLYEFLKTHGDVRDPVEAVRIAVEYWLDNAAWKEDLISAKTSGYRWKDLFLAAGTEVRMKYKGKYFYAKIQGDDFYSEIGATSPAQFANSVANSSRNAWRDLELRRPTDSKWTLADTLRLEQSL